MQKTVNIPKEWGAITLGQYQRYMERVPKAETDLMAHVLKVEALTDLNMDEALRLTMGDLTKISEKLDKVLGSDSTTRLRFHIDVKGTAFGFHPKLMDMTAGEYADLSSLDGGFWA